MGRGWSVLGAATAALLALSGGHAEAAEVRPERFFVYNLTSSTDLGGVFLAPAGTTQWGPNQVLNDKDHQVEPTERVAMTGVAHGVFDVRVVTAAGHACVKRVDLTRETTFDIVDADLVCR